MTKIALFQRIFATIGIGVLFLARSAMASEFSVDIDKAGIALKGHDAVAYFVTGQAAMGSREITAKVGGATYQFASAKNRSLFLSNPKKYRPAYGGFCAYGITFKVKVKGDPKAWKIVDDVLYINSSPDSLVKWSKDIKGNIAKADKIWPVIKNLDPDKL